MPCGRSGKDRNDDVLRTEIIIIIIICHADNVRPCYRLSCASLIILIIIISVSDHTAPAYYSYYSNFFQSPPSYFLSGLHFHDSLYHHIVEVSYLLGVLIESHSEAPHPEVEHHSQGHYDSCCDVHPAVVEGSRMGFL